MNEQYIWDYLDGQLSENECKEVERLLQEDSAMQATYNRLRLFNDLLIEDNLLNAPEGFSEMVTKSISQHKFKFSIKGILPYWMAFLILNLLIILINKGESLLPDIPLLEPESQSNWLPFFNLFATICIGLTLLYFLDRFLNKRIKTPMQYLGT